jgi:hypothetical protein
MDAVMKLTAVNSEAERARYKIVRRDTFAEVPGLILSANEETGLCLLRSASGASQEHNFGLNGLSIVRVAR